MRLFAGRRTRIRMVFSGFYEAGQLQNNEIFSGVLDFRNPKRNFLGTVPMVDRWSRKVGNGVRTAIFSKQKRKFRLLKLF